MVMSIAEAPPRQPDGGRRGGQQRLAFCGFIWFQLWIKCHNFTDRHDYRAHDRMTPVGRSAGGFASRMEDH